MKSYDHLRDVLGQGYDINYDAFDMFYDIYSLQINIKY